MSHYRLVAPSSFCWNKSCPDYGKVNLGNIVKFGRTAKGTQRYQCRTCKKTFVENIGTVFYGRHHSRETILECLAMLSERVSLASIHRVKGIKEETVIDWLREASNHVEELEALMLANYQLTRVQLDAMWSYVGNKGEKGVIQKRAIEAASGEAQQ
jgi:transposase-like protein